MPLNLQPNLIGGGDPNQALLSNNVTLPNAAPPLSAPAAAPTPAPAPVTPAPTPVAPANPLANVGGYTNKYDQIFDEAQGKLEDLLSQKQSISPMGLALSRGFFKPTKTGSFSETLGNVAEEVGNAQGEMQKNEISNVQARMALAKAASDRQRERDSEQLMSQLYKQSPTGMKMDPLVAARLAAVMKDPRLLQQAATEEKSNALADAGKNVLKTTTYTDSNGKPQITMELDPLAFQKYAQLTGDPLGSASKYASTLGEMRKNGMLPQSPTAGTVFDPIMLMADSLGAVGPALKLQAKRYAEEVKSGLMTQEAADKMADHLLTMATHSMTAQEARAAQETFKTMSLAMTAQNQAFMRQNQQERTDLIRQAAEDKKNEKQEKRDAALDQQYETMRAMKDKVDEVRSHPGRYSGLSGAVNPMKVVPGTDAYGFTANLGVLKDKAFLTQVQQMRGLGALSNTEGAKVTNALASFDPNLSYAEQERQFDYVTKKMQQGMENIQRIKRGEKPIYGEPDTPVKGGTAQPASTSKVRTYSPEKGLSE